MTLRWYWFKFRALPVTVWIEREHHLHWQWICGVQIGPWFIGAIRGHQVETPYEPVQEEMFR